MPEQLIRIGIEASRMDWVAKDIVVRRDFFDADECARGIAASEAARFQEATVSTEDGDLMLKDVRNNDRLIVDNPGRAGALFARIAPFLPRARGAAAIGLNERLRIYRYGPGQKFDWHFDGCYEPPEKSARSAFTFMVYLNDGFEGGGTTFRVGKRKLRIMPEAGMALVFRHTIEHCGDEVLVGTKYVLRTDVLYPVNG